MDIKDYIGGRVDKVRKFEQLSKGKTKAEVRELEMKLLKPEKVPEFVGTVQQFNINNGMEAKIVAPDEESWLLINKYFTVANYIERCISDISLLIGFLKEMEEGRISYDKKTKTFTYFPENESGRKKGNCSTKRRRLNRT